MWLENGWGRRLHDVEGALRIQSDSAGEHFSKQVDRLFRNPVVGLQQNGHSYEGRFVNSSERGISDISI